MAEGRGRRAAVAVLAGCLLVAGCSGDKGAAEPTGAPVTTAPATATATAGSTPTASATASPSATPTETVTPTAAPTATPTATPTAAPSPSPTPTPTAPAASPTPAVTPTAPPPRPPAPAVPGIDWAGTRTVVLGGGWSVAPCPGGAPLRCFRRSGRVQGQQELLTFPTDSISFFAGRSPAAALRLLAQDAISEFRKDRAQGCKGYTVRVDPIRSARVARRAGVRYSVDLLRSDGTVDERVVSYATVVGDRVVLFVSSAAAPRPCLPAEGATFTPSVLRGFEPLLDGGVAAATLPDLLPGADQ